MENDNEGVHKFWFEKEIISLKHLISQFDLQKISWLYKKYTPELHGQDLFKKKFNSFFTVKLIAILFMKSSRRNLSLQKI